MEHDEYFEIPDQVKDDEEFAAHYDDFPLYQVYVSCLRSSDNTKDSVMYAPSLWHEANKIIRDVLSAKHIEYSYYRLQGRLMRCQYSHELKKLLLLALQLIVYNQHQRSNTEMKKVFGKIIDDINENIETFRRYVTNTYKKDEDGCYIFLIPYTICPDLIEYFEKGYLDDNYDYTAIDEEAERIFKEKGNVKSMAEQKQELVTKLATLQSKFDAYIKVNEKEKAELKEQLKAKEPDVHRELNQDESVSFVRNDKLGKKHTKNITARQVAEIVNQYTYSQGLSKSDMKEMLASITGLSSDSFQNYLKDIRK